MPKKNPPKYRESKEYQDLLKKVGFNPVKSQRVKRPKSIRTSFIESGAVYGGHAKSYYDDTSGKVSGKPLDKNKLDLSNESNAIKKEIERKQNLLRAINMPAPRDLSDDVPERTIDQKNLISNFKG